MYENSIRSLAGDTAPDVSDLYSTIAPDYDGSYARPTHRRVYDQLAWEHVSTIGLPPDSLIVDAGCGTGRWVPRWLDAGHRVIGIERAPGMIATLAGRGLGDRFTLIESAMEEASIAAGSADLVLAMGSVQYALDPAAMIRRFATWVRPGGAVCIYVDSLMSLVLELTRDGRHDEAQQRLQTRRGEFRQTDHVAALTLYDRRAIEADFAAAGLIGVQCHGLAVGACALRRAGLTEAMERDEPATMKRERALSADPAMSDAGLHILATGFRPTTR